MPVRSKGADWDYHELDECTAVMSKIGDNTPHICVEIASGKFAGY